MRVHCPQAKICCQLSRYISSRCSTKQVNNTAIQAKKRPETLLTKILYLNRGWIEKSLKSRRRRSLFVLGFCKVGVEILSSDSSEFSPGLHFGWYPSLHVLLEASLRDFQGQGLDK